MSILADFTVSILSLLSILESSCINRETVPSRESVLDFDLDPPLTYQGLKEAFHTGKSVEFIMSRCSFLLQSIGASLREKNLPIHFCYSSPSLRCVQTAAKILEGLQLHNKLKIRSFSSLSIHPHHGYSLHNRIEPGLFECTGWYTKDDTSEILTMPKFLTRKELVDNRYPIDKNYREQMNVAAVSRFETELQLYQRSHAVATAILAMHENEYISQIPTRTNVNSTAHTYFICW